MGWVNKLTDQSVTFFLSLRVLPKILNPFEIDNTTNQVYVWFWVYTNRFDGNTENHSMQQVVTTQIPAAKLMLLVNIHCVFLRHILLNSLYVAKIYWILMSGNRNNKMISLL